jgi:hypothetical protein
MADNETIPIDTENGALSPRQEAVALGVASGLSLTAAARKANVGVPTAKRWSATSPAFRRRVQELRAEMTSQALGRMAAGMSEAADVLRGLLAAEAESIRLGAARSLLDLGMKLQDSVDLENRLADLENLTTTLRANQK